MLNEARAAGRWEVANGPFPPGTPGYLDETGYPQFDLEGARELLAEVKAKGARLARRQMSYKTTNDPFSLTTAELLKETWEEAGFQGHDRPAPARASSSTRPSPATSRCSAGATTAGIDPDQQFVWWSSTTTGVALNFGRIIDPEVDRLLGQIRSNIDTASREERR